MIRKIVHIDLDAFFCAVEQLSNPALRDTPFAVGGMPEQRGVVSSCSYSARQLGIHSAMPMARAKQICPNLIIVPPSFKVYSQLSHQIMESLEEFSSLIEQISIDEAFLDISDIQESSLMVGERIQKNINDRFQLPCSLGIASNKLVAKIATDYGKSQNRSRGYPNAITVVESGTERDFLAPLPVIAMLGIGPKTSARLQEKGIHTIGNLANLSETTLIELFGKFGTTISFWSKGIDDRPIITSHEVKSISRETTFPKDISQFELLEKTLAELTSSVCRQLRRENLFGSTVRLKIRWSNFTKISRQITLDKTTNNERVIFNAARNLLEKTCKQNKSVRLLGVGISGFSSPASQLSLWETVDKREEILMHTLDELQAKFGKNKIYKGKYK